jgi:PTH2 family peptidyl-tRNA hydrolase
MVIVVRSDLKMSRGKLAAQCSHAAVSVLDKANRKILSGWKKEGQKKVVVKVKSENELLELANKSKKLDIPYSIVSDAGLTELIPGTLTALAIGPDKEEKINKITGSLPLLK